MKKTRSEIFRSGLFLLSDFSALYGGKYTVKQNVQISGMYFQTRSVFTQTYNHRLARITRGLQPASSSALTISFLCSVP